MRPPSIREEQWYVLHTRSRFEAAVTDRLTQKRFDVFLPTQRVRSKRKDRRLMLDVPLFNGFVFVKTLLNPDNHLAILKTMGAVRLLGFNDGPVPANPTAIESLKIMVAQKQEITTGNLFKKGDVVRVCNGPFKGLLGHFLEHRGNCSVAVHIETMAQFASVQIHREDIELITS